MDNFEKLFNKSLHFLSFRPRSEKEVRDYLKKNKAEEKTILIIVEKLKDYKFLDDIDFAKRWIEQRIKIKPKAWRVIKFELERKGITKEIIELVSTKNQELIINDSQTALKLAQYRLERLQKEIPQKQKEKLYRYLASKGYSYDTIKEVVDRLLSK